VHEKRIEIRWRDVDAYRHVNNAVYATYLEECRDELAERVLADVGASVSTPLRPDLRAAAAEAGLDAAPWTPKASVDHRYGALVFDAPRRTLHVANIKGHPTTPKPDKTGQEAPPGAAGFNSHHYQGSLSLDSLSSQVSVVVPSGFTTRTRITSTACRSGA